MLSGHKALFSPVLSNSQPGRRSTRLPPSFLLKESSLVSPLKSFTLCSKWMGEVHTAVEPKPKPLDFLRSLRDIDWQSEDMEGAVCVRALQIYLTGTLILLSITERGDSFQHKTTHLSYTRHHVPFDQNHQYEQSKTGITLCSCLLCLSTQS